jgi:serine phosphatase RsbU (regulator of sigma subunit)
VAHVDPGRVQLAREIQRRYPPDARRREGVLAVLDTGQPALHSDIPEDLLAATARGPEHLELLRSVGMRSVMIVPMMLRDRVLGAITFVTAESGRRYDEHDLALARDLGLRAATAIDNARLYETRSAIAHTLQASLLPPHLPEIRGMDVAATYHASGEGHEVGGDFYDVFSTARDQWFVVIGDVCGKGAEAAAVTALARYTLRAAAVRRRSPSGLLRMVNEAMLRHEQVGGRFCTVACAQLDLSRRRARVTVACGGHPLPLVRRAAGAVQELGAPGTLLGLVPDPELHDVPTELAQGDTLLLYTDGLTEARAPAHVWSPRELSARFAAAPDGSAAGMVADLVAAALGDLPAPRDDIAVLALRAA